MRGIFEVVDKTAGEFSLFPTNPILNLETSGFVPIVELLFVIEMWILSMLLSGVVAIFKGLALRYVSVSVPIVMLFVV